MSLHQGRHRAGEEGPAVVREGRHRATEPQPPGAAPQDQPHEAGEDLRDRVTRDVAIPALWGASGTLAAVALAALVLAGPGEPGAWLAAPPPGFGPSDGRPAGPGGDAPKNSGITPVGWQPGADGGLGRTWSGARLYGPWAAVAPASSCTTEGGGTARPAISGTTSAAPVDIQPSSPSTAELPGVTSAVPASVGTGVTSASPSPVAGRPLPPAAGTPAGGSAGQPPATGQPVPPSSAVGRIVEPVVAAAEPVTEPVQTRVVEPITRAAEPVTRTVEPVTRAVETAVVEPATEAAQPVTGAVESVTEAVPVLPEAAEVGEAVGSLPVGLP